jgi:hypothetical protein
MNKSIKSLGLSLAIALTIVAVAQSSAHSLKHVVVAAASAVWGT